MMRNLLILIVHLQLVISEVNCKIMKASQDTLNIARISFELWQNLTNFEFVYDQTDHDKLISVAKQRVQHDNLYFCQTGECAFPFDGEGGLLGH